MHKLFYIYKENIVVFIGIEYKIKHFIDLYSEDDTQKFKKRCRVNIKK